MSVKNTLSAKTFPARLTHIRFLVNVSGLVYPQSGGMCECSAAVFKFTLKRFFSCVLPDMGDHVTLSLEAHPAVLAGYVSSSHMFVQFVTLQIPISRKLLATDITCEVPHISVGSPGRI